MKLNKRVAGALGAIVLPMSLAMVPAPAASAQDGLQWGPCPAGSAAAPEALCADFEAPKDYKNPGAGTITLTMSKIPAASGQSRGVIAGNPGGPGGDAIGMFAGSNEEAGLESRVKLPDNVRQNYDLVAVEPRGLAYGEPLECDIEGIPAAQIGLSFSAGLARDLCNYAQPGYIDTVNTENTARDLDVARQKLGEDKLSLYGVSYGGLLMSTYATLFPQHTDRTILDSPMSQAKQWAGLSSRGKQRRDSLETMFQWIADRDAEYGLGNTPLKVYQRWSRVVEKEVGVPAQLTPPPAQIGDLPPGIAKYHGQALPVVNQALPPVWRLYSAMYTIGKGSPMATAVSPLFQYTYYQGLYDDSKWSKVAEYIRNGKLDEAMPEMPKDEEVLKEVARQQVTFATVERAIVCNENRVRIRPELFLPHQIDTLTGGDIINGIEGAFITGATCAGWPKPKPAPTVNGDKLEIKPLLLGFSHDNAVGSGAVWDMQRRMGGEVVVLEGHNHGVLVNHTDQVADKVNAYFGV